MLVALSLVLLGFAHAPMLRAATSDVEGYVAGAEFTASADSYCGAAPSQPASIPANDCPVCTLAKAMSLAAPLNSARVPLGVAKLAMPLPESAPVALATLYLPPARGPPAIS